MHSLVKILIFSFLSGYFPFIPSDMKQPDKTKLSNHINPSSFSLNAIHFKLVCHSNILLSMVTEVKEKESKIKTFCIDQLASVLCDTRSL